MSQITTPTKEQILKAAECKTTKDALQMLFPDVFYSPVEINSFNPIRTNKGERLLELRVDVNDRFWLNGITFDWELERIGDNYELIPTRK